MEQSNKSLASDLAKIAMGEMHSDQVLRASVERLETLRDQHEHDDPSITKARIVQALVHCKLALHGIHDAHHKLQDASVVLAMTAEMEPRNARMPSGDVDPAWRAQAATLKAMTDSINKALEPEVIQADFAVEKLREYAADVELEFDGKVASLDDGSARAVFKRADQRGIAYQVTLEVPPGAAMVTAFAKLARGDDVLVESEPMPRRSVLGALDAAVHSFESLQSKLPTAPAKTQAEAKALAQRVAESLGATLGGWSPTRAQEWVRSTLATPDGKAIRVSASTGGVVNVNGDPYTPDAGRQLNVTDEAVATSMRVALERTQAPAFPLRTDRVFADAPGELGAAWGNLCEEENRLAGFLSSLEEGTAVVLDGDAWYLELGDDQQLVLMHGEVVDGQIKNASSRFDLDMGWVDIGVEDVVVYTSRVSSVADDFMIDRALWKTMKVEHSDSPNLGM